MAGNHDEEGPIHQAPWVVPVTVGACFAFALVVLLLRYFVGADLGTMGM